MNYRACACVLVFCLGPACQQTSARSTLDGLGGTGAGAGGKVLGSGGHGTGGAAVGGARAFTSGGAGGTVLQGGAGGTVLQGGAGGRAFQGGAGMGGRVGAGGSGGGSLGGMMSSAGGASVVDEPHAPGYVRSIIGVGSGGIRVLSRNDGLTWTKVAQLGVHGGDDVNLLVSVAWGAGKWIATFTWKSWSSPDGLVWTEFDPGTSCRGLVRVAYGNGTWVGTACNPTNDSTNTWLSSDGVGWVKRGTIASGFHTNLLFAPADGKFVAWGEDNHKVFSSPDGVTWTELPGMTDAAVCDGAIRTAAACKQSFGGTANWIRPSGTHIERSTNGNTFTDVYSDDAMNGVAAYFSLSYGWAPPQ